MTASPSFLTVAPRGSFVFSILMILMLSTVREPPLQLEVGLGGPLGDEDDGLCFLCCPSTYETIESCARSRASMS